MLSPRSPSSEFLWHTPLLALCKSRNHDLINYRNTSRTLRIYNPLSNNLFTVNSLQFNRLKMCATVKILCHHCGKTIGHDWDSCPHAVVIERKRGPCAESLIGSKILLNTKGCEGCPQSHWGPGSLRRWLGIPNSRYVL